MKFSINELYWLAGILEGEGSFSIKKQYNKGKGRSRPWIQIGMTDKDVIERVAKLLKVNCRGPYNINHLKWKPFYSCDVVGSRAAGWMMTLYSLLSQRRQEAIIKALEDWKQQ